jgi:hypothetical protein
MSTDTGLIDLPTWKDGPTPAIRYQVGSGPKPVYATHYRTREHTHDGHDPECWFCHHIAERVFSVTEATHNVELTDGPKGMSWACASCWSELSLQNPDHYEED